jgi:hypothetical protein
MDHTEAQDRMREIQRIMERATLWTILPGWPAVIGGLCVWVGCIVSYTMIRSFDFADILNLTLAQQTFFCVMWFCIGIGAILIDVVVTARSAKAKGISATIRSARVSTFSLTPPVVVAMALTFKFLVAIEPQHDEIQYIVPIWMMLYGAGVYTAGLFSVRAPRILGITFLVFGVVALLALPQYGLITAALSFGLLHVLFGAYILQRRKAEAIE